VTDLDARRTLLLAARELPHEPDLGFRLARRLAPRVPPAAVRMAQLVAAHFAPLSLSRRALAPAAASRRAALGEKAAGPPRFLLRVDEFPYATSLDHPDRYGPGPSARFHAVLREANIPYLMAVVPQVVRNPLDPEASGSRALNSEELDLLAQMASDGVELAAHGLTHRTRDRRPRHRSELIGLSTAQTRSLIDQSLALLAHANITPRVFVPPFNRFGEVHYDVLASCFDIICGGPETIAFLGAQPTPRWLGDAVYCPCYPPLYGRARDVLPEVRRLIGEQPGTWVPLTLHLAWEIDDGLDAMRRLAEVLAPCAVGWSDLLGAIDAIRRLSDEGRSADKLEGGTRGDPGNLSQSQEIGNPNAPNRGKH
jgi:peptidoglycan/xylan/chitin deacetylase (PgdA/CDA1 family)